MTYHANKLIEAIRAGSLFAVSAALDDGADIEETDIHGFPGLPLRTACFCGNVAIVRELLSRGANPDAPSGDGSNGALRLALRCDHKEIAALLLKNCASVPGNVHIPPEIFAIDCAPLAVELQAPVLPEETPADNLIDFTATSIPESPASAPQRAPLDVGNMLEFTPANLNLAVADESHADTLGTETQAISADLLFLDADELPPLALTPHNKPQR